MSLALAELIAPVSEAARAAGRAIMQVYTGPFDIEQKGDGSPLTQADLAAHRVIVERLEALTPALPVLSEESRAIPYAVRAGWRRYWLVDPLDGTKEFIRRNGEFTVNIALIENGRPSLGVVYAPVRDILYSGCLGHGAWRTDGTGTPRPLHVEHFSGGIPRLVASRSHAGQPVTDLIARLEREFGAVETLSMGSSFKLCLVAEGNADIYPRLGPTSEWDTAAAHAVVNAAGGRVERLDGRELVYNKADLLNPWFVVSDGSYDWLQYLDEERG